jgi:arylsulfate sulfotransferase
MRIPLSTALIVMSFLLVDNLGHAQVTTTTTLSVSPASLAEGASATLSAKVTPSSGSTPTGKVSFYSGSLLLASASLNGSGAASVTVSSANVAPGTYSVVAKYAGDASDTASTSAPVTATVLADTTTTATTASSAYLLGQTATFTAVVAGKSGTPTGSVSFFYAGNKLGSATLNSGTATFSANVPTNYEPGTYLVTAKYCGDAIFAPSSGSFSVSLDQHFAIAPGGAGVAPSRTTQLSLIPNPGGTQTWYVNGISGGNSTLGTISSSGLYTAPDTTSLLTVQITAASTTQSGFTTPTIPVYVIPPGVVAKTANGQVASFTINLPAGSSVSANFGTTTSYGLNTWSVPAPSGGGSVQVLVAGMLAETPYHIEGLVSLPGGITYKDKDNTFTTSQSIPTSSIPDVAVTTNPDYTPQPGVEFLDRLSSGANVVDLAGNFLWGYPTPVNNLIEIQPFKLLSNGHLLITQSPTNTYPLGGTVLPEGTPIQVLEVDYADTVFHQLTLAALQSNLNASGYLNYQGQQITLTDIHHDATVNPTSGHWILITNTLEFLTGLSGYPKGVSVLGDVIIDVDPNNNFAVDWVWNEFDHLDIDRQPMSFPDWTHTNAVVYSPSDHNILVSIRHQNWVLKLNYNDAAGDGTILWHLGYQGDFTLIGGAGTQDWQYAQHGPSLTTSNSAGVFGLTLMDNGNDRVFPTGFICPVASTGTSCLYSRAPVFTIDENAMTATLSNAAIGPAYTYWGGNSELLSNGNLEADYCQVNNTTNTIVQETTQGEDPQVVLKMSVNGSTQYRAFRQSSLYPGVTWTSEALQFQAKHADHSERNAKSYSGAQ